MEKVITMQALEESILHWEENLQVAKERRFGDMEWGCGSCALCDQFMAEACQGCPVMLASGFSMCRETPYYQASIQMGGYAFSNRREIPDDISDLTDAIQAELDFLKSLRDRGNSAQPIKGREPAKCANETAEIGSRSPL